MQKLGSVRYKSHPGVRRGTFTTDSNLVALRYEKTAQAEPPIPVHSRNPIRIARPPSSSSSSCRSNQTSQSQPRQSQSQNQRHHHHPIVVAPPLGILPPPTEEHPAFRTTSSSLSSSPSSTPSHSPRTAPRTSPLDEWKRDSGVARTNSSATIREECEEDAQIDALALPGRRQYQRVKIVVDDDDDEDFLSTDISVVSPSPSVSPAPSPVPSSAVQPAIDDPFLDVDAPDSERPSLSSVRSEIMTRMKSMTPPPPPPQPAAHVTMAVPESSESPTKAPSSGSKTPRSSQQSQRSPRKLVKSMSSQSASRFRTKSLSEVVHSVTMPVESLLRGSSNNSSPTRSRSGSSGAESTNKDGKDSSGAKTKHHFWSRSRSSSTKSDSAIDPFLPLEINIPTDSLLEDDFLKTLSFSNRGSIMLRGQPLPNFDSNMDLEPPKQHEPSPLIAITTSSDNASTPSRTVTPPSVVKRASQQPSNEDDSNKQPPKEEEPALMPPPDIRVLAADVEKESQKVRSLYTVGEDGLYGEPGARFSYYSERLEPTPEAPSEENELDAALDHPSPAWGTPRSGSSFSPCDLHKTHFELAGGLEDWEDVDGADVDRYGFISAPRPSSRVGTPTELKSAQYSPRKRSVLHKRDPLGLSPLGGRRTPVRKVSTRSLNTQTSELSISPSVRSSRSVIRQAGNLLPHNRDRRWMDEAGDMLNVAPGLQDVEEEVKTEKVTESLKRKEWERSEKWRKMAKVVRKGGEGEGMEFEFDVRNPKLIDRTWKGIPDRWRGAAWWSFLAASAQNNKYCASELDIITEFHKLQARSSPDDVQIDLDVPRTISRHIMFRRRYRGGQRLLFRVLHAISIYFPETGYVQGMASLAATLLCYYDEEKCFVMLVRMWKCRGLARLYRPGFEELMGALAEFNSRWLSKEVADKLAELCIDITAYGTRWYLTLFNLSIPFPAQLRVWDVFLLLGDDIHGTGESQPPPPTKPGAPIPTAGEYDVLHATSAALVQALREVLLDSDFENAMKALTSWIPIKDEDLLMKVTKAEWKSHHGKKKA